jgi:ribosomal protein L29
MEAVAAASANVALESIGSDPVSGGAQTYEQITESLKSGETEETPTPEPDVETPAATPEDTPPAKPPVETPAAEEFRTMTDEEIKALPPELQNEAKALRKRFQSAYTKKTMDLAEIRRKADFMDRFDSDPALQEQVIQQVLSRRQPAATSPTAASPVAQTGPPAALVEMAKKSLPPEMQWMADSQANFGWQLIQAVQSNMVQPLQQTLTTMQKAKQEQEYLGVLGHFADANPGWEDKEDDMVEVLEFLKSPALTHKRWGSKHDLLYRLAQGDKAEDAAVQKSIEKTAAKVQSRGAERSTAPNVQERIRDRKLNNDQAWALAVEQAKAGAQ